MKTFTILAAALGITFSSKVLADPINTDLPALSLNTRAMAPIPQNEWPDPNFYIEDAGGSPIAGMNDALTGMLPTIRVTGYTSGSRTVTVRTNATGTMFVGEFVKFAAPCDAALIATPLQVQSIIPNTAFNVTLEYPSGTPSTTAACTVTQVMMGNTTPATGDNITSNVQRYANGTLWPYYWISSRPAHVRLLHGVDKVLIVRKVTNDKESIYWQTSDYTQRLAGTQRAVGLAVYVANGSGAYAQAEVNDGSTMHYSSAVASTASRTWVSAQANIPPTSSYTSLGVALYGPVGSTFVLGEFESALSASPLPDGSFSVPGHQTITVLASISPYVGQTFTIPAHGFDVNMAQASNMVIQSGPDGIGGVTDMIGNLEGQCSVFPCTFSTNTASPSIYGPMVFSPSNSYYGFASGSWPLRRDHQTFYGTTGATLSHVSWDIHAFFLNGGP